MVKNKFLLDTRIFIWAMENSNELQRELKEDIASPENTVYVSVASIWEIIIKKSLQKITVDFNIEESIRKTGFTILAIETAHVLEVEDLPYHHRDLFDRLLIAQARVENLTFITHDKVVKKYRVSIRE